MTLKRDMGLGGLIFYGTGTILGAGIFVVIGEVMGEAGPAAPLAYALAGLVAVFTALSFAEIGARVPTAAGAIDYVEAGFGDRAALPAIVGWLLIAANIVSGATITTGFVSYLSSFVALPGWMATIGLLAVVGFVSVAGMKQAAWFMTATTALGLVTLLAILWLARDGLLAWPGLLRDGSVWEGAGSTGFTGILAGAFLAIYSFIGFGDMAQTAEELKRPKRNLPRGIVVTILIVLAFYLLIATALGGLSDIDGIAQADAPLVYAATRGGEFPALPLALASLLVIVNGALTQIVAASRLLMDLGRDGRGGVPGKAGEVSDTTNTPVFATLAVLAVVLILALFVPLGTLASGTSLVILMVFAMVNAALWRLKRKTQPEDVPHLWVSVPLIGLVLCVLTIVGQVLLWTTGGS
ncbi:APC family permease [Citromicrobium bathyomarinum]|mgnify:FL=1|uniref:APC family permease n=1 Tax=Sphingomonadales TaxID=204457 RepID=UPI000C658C93|nr:amino acid permease [Citromicrobium sp.]MBO81899.1 amino acid permease [Citromicrobium sp.]|tara:strand:+ start:262 stop:1491 length:1230 start_codon:yes stop_codon:yes gene_type:complete